MKRVLMIAFHFPPIQGSSGVHRTVQFARYLPSFGWAPIIVAPHPRAYPAIGDESWAKLPEEAVVKRVFAVDSARHLAINGRYFGFTAIPDRWVSWWPGAVFECLRLVRKYRPHVIWSTFPIATAHLIGLTVQRLTGLPWVADFRDPMIQERQITSQLNHKMLQSLEKEIVRRSSCCTLVTRSVLDNYKQRYPAKKPINWQLIENGYDESLFEPYDHLYDVGKQRPVDRPLKILHSGRLYSSGRNPLPFLEAVKSLVDKNIVDLEIIFRGCGNEAEIGEYIHRLQLANVVKLLPSISYDNAIKEMIQSDVLAVFQGSVYNNQIPAKIYEYIRAGRPILALTDEAGETARMLRDWGGTFVANIESKENIEVFLKKIIDDINTSIGISRDIEKVKLLSRYSGTKKMKNIYNELILNRGKLNE